MRPKATGRFGEIGLVDRPSTPHRLPRATPGEAVASHLDAPTLVRRVLEQPALRMDGTPAGARTFGRKRSVLHNALEYAVELEVLERNLLPQVKWTPPRETKSIDERVVLNPRQARRLLEAGGRQHVEGQPRRSSDPALVAFFAVMYYSALRPEEAVMLRKGDLQLPAEGWGELLVSETAPAAGSVWTDEEYASPLGKRPYDLRHACVSTWWGSGVPSTQIAEWAGHSVAVLHQIYAKVLAGQEDSARRRIEAALQEHDS